MEEQHWLVYYEIDAEYIYFPSVCLQTLSCSQWLQSRQGKEGRRAEKQ